MSGDRADALRDAMTALYRAYNARGRLLYVGIAADVVDRMINHRYEPWFPDIAAMSVTLYPARHHAARAEVEAIAAEWPLWNVAQSPWASVSRQEWRNHIWRRRAEADHFQIVICMTRDALSAELGRRELDVPA